MNLVLAAAAAGDSIKEGKAIGLALGIGLGSLGAGIGIGNIFGSMIQSVARQPELRGELQGIMWLGFALTEAVVFYGLLGGLLGYALVS
jgi:F-type H+-transporting ATPase subunit c